MPIKILTWYDYIRILDQMIKIRSKSDAKITEPEIEVIIK